MSIFNYFRDFKFHLILISVLYLSACSEKIAADIAIINGTVYDGLSTEPRQVAIGIKSDKIIFIGDPASLTASKVIDAKGLIVSPGFIDPHTHADRDLKIPTEAHNKPFLLQGITTVVVGNDGDSFFPTAEHVDLYTKQGIGTNVVLLTGHGTIRQQVLGNSNRFPSPTELVQMQNLVEEEMKAGAFGLSTGLFYAPGSYSNTAEIVALAKVVARYNGIYDTHLRDESSYTVGLIPAIEEAIEIGRHAQLPIHISHIKCLGVDVWNQSETIVDLIEKAREEGIQVTANQYPYDASATGLKAAVVPRWAESGGKDSLFLRYAQPNLKSQILTETKKNIARRGGPAKLLIVKAEDSLFVGKNLAQLADMLNLPPEEAVYTILKTGYVRVASFNMNPVDIERFMKQPWVMTGSDGNTGHPRKYGSFPRKYHHYVQTKKTISLSQFINNSTANTAAIFKIPKRGQLKVGYYADIIAFNPKTFRDRADYQDAFRFAEGLEFSLINGQFAVENRQATGKLYGKVLKKKALSRSN